MVSYDPYRIRITDRVSRELLAICSYIEQRSPQNAELVATEILKEIDSLDLFPHRHEEYLDSAEPWRIIRKVPVLSFVIYYHVIEDDRLVEILSVVHGSQQRPTRFD